MGVNQPNCFLCTYTAVYDVIPPSVGISRSTRRSPLRTPPRGFRS